MCRIVCWLLLRSSVHQRVPLRSLVRICGKTGHTPDNCFLHHPEKLAEFRARRAARTTRGRGTVSTPMSVAAAGSSSLSWVLDSGASFHVTSDQSQLVACKPVDDGASIQTADGTSCPITHQSSLSNFYFFVRCLFCTSVVYEPPFCWSTC
jgi:hypothetical protein